MSRQSTTSWLFVLAIVLTTIAPVGAQADTMGSSNYANFVLDPLGLNAPIYLRLNESGTSADLGDPVVNSGTLGTASLKMIWGIHKSNGVDLYSDSQPGSGIAAVGPSIMINGNPCVGLEDTNMGAQFIAYPTQSNSKAFNVYDGTATGEKVAILDQEYVTYSLFFKTTDNNQNPRMITSHSENSNRFDLIMANGKLCVVTAGVSATSNWLADSTATFNDGNWHHLVAIRNGDNSADVDLYVDGAEIALTARMGTPSYMSGGTAPQAGSTAAGYGLRIGAHGNQNRGWTGYMDEIAMWGQALTPAQAQGLYQAAISVPEPSTMALLAALLLGGAVCSRRRSN